MVKSRAVWMVAPAVVVLFQNESRPTYSAIRATVYKQKGVARVSSASNGSVGSSRSWPRGCSICNDTVGCGLPLTAE